MGCLRVLGVVVAVLGVVFGFLYQNAVQQRPIDVNSIIAEGGNYLTLRDGRILEYFDFGNQQSASTVLILHGAAQTGKFYRDIFAGRNPNFPVRMIAPSIPGHGQSSSQASRTLLDFGEDIKELMNHLNIRRFSVMGVSMGGPHASAVAYVLNDRIDNVMLVVPMSGDHYEGALESYRDRFGLRMMVSLTSVPFLNEIFADAVCRFFFGTPQGIESYMKANCPNDWAEFETTPFHDNFLKDASRSPRWSSVGFSQVMKWAKNWPFNLAEIVKPNRKIFLYTSLNDTLIPSWNQDWYMSKLKSAILHSVPGGHFAHLKSPQDFEAMINKLTS